MALEETGVQLVAEGADGFSNALDDAASSLGFLESAAQSASGGIDVMGEIITGALRQIGTIAVDSLLAAGSAVAGFIGDSFAGALEAETTMARLTAQIEATGGVAGITADEAAALADEFKGLAGG